MNNSATWTSSNGTSFTFSVYVPGTTTWNNEGGIYVFAYWFGGQWRPLYIGQAESIMERFRSHERWQEAVQRGATHVLILQEPSSRNRDLLERALIKELQPPMNQLLR